MSAFNRAIQESKFKLGQLVVTCGVNDACAKSEALSRHVFKALRRHASGDWGDVCDEDKAVNDDALKNGGRLLSSFDGDKDNGTERVWVITEWDRSVTTVLFPSEY